MFARKLACVFGTFLTRGVLQPARRRGWATSLLHHAIQQRATLATRTTPRLLSPPKVESESPFAKPSKATKKKHAFVPRKAAVNLTDKARKFFKALLENPPRQDIVGVMLNYGPTKNVRELRMVFSFQFVTADEIDFQQDEGVSLELVKEVDRGGNTIEVPKSPSDSQLDGLPKLYVHHNAFLKVLGATVDVETETVTPILYDREGNIMDPNA